VCGAAAAVARDRLHDNRQHLHQAADGGHGEDAENQQAGVAL